MLEAGPSYAAVTVVLAFIVTVQVAVLVEVHPPQDEKVSLPEVAGAVSVTVAPEL